jgi:pSer/pThr/pTyr-binding forkhead associated (FHA) protein
MEVLMLVVQGKQRGQTIRFPNGEFIFGRGLECHLRPNSEWVSRQHCLFRVSDNGVHIKDLGSTNGTLINGTRLIGERRLATGDLLQLGQLVLELKFTDTQIFRETVEHIAMETEVGFPALKPNEAHSPTIEQATPVKR